MKEPGKIGKEQFMKESDIRNQEVLEEYLALVEADVKKLFRREEFEKVPCPACGADAYTVQFEKCGFPYVTCDKCGTLYANPRPTQEQLDVFYSESDSTRFWVEEFFMPFAEARRQKIFIPRAKEFAEEFPEYRDKRIGDIGAGFGLFLEELKKIWPDCNLCAIEPSVEMVKICEDKGLRTVPKMFEDIDEEDGSFDFLCMFELFEHLNKPKVFLEKANRVLSDGGRMLITTLNGKGFDIQLLWEKHKNVNPPNHLNFINPDSIKLLLGQCGFEAEKITTPGKLDWDIIEITIESNRADLGRWWKLVCSASDEAKSELQNWISKNCYSSHIRIVAKKVRNI